MQAAGLHIDQAAVVGEVQAGDAGYTGAGDLGQRAAVGHRAAIGRVGQADIALQVQRAWVVQCVAGVDKVQRRIACQRAQIAQAAIQVAVAGALRQQRLASGQRPVAPQVAAARPDGIAAERGRAAGTAVAAGEVSAAQAEMLGADGPQHGGVAGQAELAFALQRHAGGKGGLAAGKLQGRAGGCLEHRARLHAAAAIGKQQRAGLHVHDAAQAAVQARDRGAAAAGGLGQQATAQQRAAIGRVGQGDVALQIERAGVVQHMAGVDEVQVVGGVDDALVVDAAVEVFVGTGFDSQRVIGGQQPLACQIAAAKARAAVQAGLAGRAAGAAVAAGVGG